MKNLDVLVFAALAVAAAAAFAHGDDHKGKKPAFDTSKVEERAFGREGDPSKVTRTVNHVMTDKFRFTPAEVTVKRGETVRFVVANGGTLMHEMVLGTVREIKEHAELMKKFPEMEHEDANMAHVKPGARGEIIWQFTKAGEYQFACLIPGHFEAGMVGRIVVK
jgi:uncharacterized cupredoxin-like copper-binding protein